MARAALKKTIKPVERNTGTGSWKPKLGRPLGSKNRSAVAPLKATTSATRSALSRKAVPSAPKMSKAELELQLAKSERLVARLREQNKELKTIVKAAAAPKEAKPAAEPVQPVGKSVPATKAARPRVTKAAKPSRSVEDDHASE